MLFAAALAYAAALVYVLFVWSTAAGYGMGGRMLNLSPLAGFTEAYFSGGSLVHSQFMLNIILFVPLGFLLPLLFPRAAGALWKTALIALAITVFAETAQYFIFIGRSADIDDVIANFLGAVSGYALYVLAGAALQKTALWRALSAGEHPVRPRAAAAAALGLLLIFGGPFALDRIDACSPYGAFRYTMGRIPASATIAVDLANVNFGELPVYRARTGLAADTAERLLALFPAPEGAERFLASSGEGNFFYAREEGYDLGVLGNGHFHLTISGAYPEDAAGFGAWVEGLLPGLAPPGAVFTLEKVREEGAQAAGGTQSAPAAAAQRGVTALAHAKTEEETALVLGEVSFTYSGGELRIVGFIILADPVGRVETISAAKALRALRGSNSYAEEIEITSVTLVYREVRGLFLPCCSFAGTARHEGRPTLFQSTADAVKR